jgi:hypothetical protein
MKSIKFSKTGLLILAAGAFTVVLAGLGITRYSQTSEEARLEGELALSSMRLNNMDLKPLQEQLAGLEEELKNGQIQIEEAKNKLAQSVISVDMADNFYEIAASCGVAIETITTTKNQTEVYENVGCVLINVNAMVTGALPHIIDFVAALNDSFTTGFVKSTQVSINDAAAENGASANIMMIIYSYEGN